jgi:hypothetical protein
MVGCVAIAQPRNCSCLAFLVVIPIGSAGALAVAVVDPLNIDTPQPQANPSTQSIHEYLRNSTI